jgi:hypothetical protein
VAQAAHGAVANGDQEALGRHRGVASTSITACCSVHAGQVHRCEFVRATRLHVAVHLGRLAQQHVHGHVHGNFLVVGRCGVGQHQLALFGGHADHGKRAALALAEGLNSSSDSGAMAST